MTPILAETISGMTLLFDQLISTESGKGQLKTIEMTFSDSGQASDVAFSVTITDTVPENTPEPPESLLDTSAMFVTVDFVGEFALLSTEVVPLSFSTEEAFEESPRVSVLVDKKLNIKKLSDGCPDVSLYFFDEDEETWEKVNKPDREESLDTSQHCGYVLETGHWSKFAVGGVKIAANVLQSISSGSNKVQIPPSAISNITPGIDASTSISVPGGGKVALAFENVLTGGEVKVTKPTLSQKSDLFSSVGEKSATLSINNNDRSVTYTTTGELLDLDLSSVEFTGEVEATIPYDPSLLPENTDESEIRFLHHDNSEWEDVTSSVNTAENTVTGKLRSASPVIPAIIDDGTFDASYFVKNPLEKISILSIDVDTPTSSGPASLRLPVELSATFKNMQKTDQDYVLIAQIVDENGYTKSINWLTGNLDRGTDTTISFSTNLVRGQYTMKFFAWDKISQPTALSPAVQHQLRF
jgi:hypothetical protein